MNIFGMGAWEMGIILVAALVIFGPGKLPEVAGQAGRAVRDFRRMTADLSGEFEKTMAEVSDTKGTLGRELKGITGQVNSVTSSVKKDLSSTSGSAKPKSTATKSTTPRPSASKTTTSTSSAKSTSTTTASKAATSGAKSIAGAAKATAPTPKVASKADPLGDLFFSDEGSSTQRPAPPPPSVAKPAATASRAAVPASADQAVDAVARARQRRISAGYTTHRSS